MVHFVALVLIAPLGVVEAGDGVTDAMAEMDSVGERKVRLEEKDSPATMKRTRHFRIL